MSLMQGLNFYGQCYTVFQCTVFLLEFYELAPFGRDVDPSVVKSGTFSPVVWLRLIQYCTTVMLLVYSYDLSIYNS